MQNNDLVKRLSAWVSTEMEDYPTWIRAADTLMREAAEHISQLEAALKPFAEQASRYDPPEGDDDHPLWGAHTLTIGDVRRARAASSNREGGE